MTEDGAVTVGPGVAVPDLLIRRWTVAHGQEPVNRWFRALPAFLEAMCEKWQVEILPVTPPLSYNIVLFGTSRTAGDVVCKLAPPSPEVRAEIAGLELAAGDGMVPVLDSWPDVAAVLLQRIVPGTTLDQVVTDDEEATLIAARTMRRFWRDPASTTHLWPLDRWFRELYAYAPNAGHPPGSQIPDEHVRFARSLGDRLLSSPRSRTLLHGDLHHQNILWGGARGWVTIDPKGLIGERGYDVATWMLNPWYFPARDDFLPLAQRRLDILAEELGEDRRRLAEWCAFHAVLSLVWSVSDDDPADVTEGVEAIVKMRQLLD